MIYENFIRFPLSFSDLCHWSPLLLTVETWGENIKAYSFWFVLFLFFLCLQIHAFVWNPMTRGHISVLEFCSVVVLLIFLPSSSWVAVSSDGVQCNIMASVCYMRSYTEEPLQNSIIFEPIRWWKRTTRSWGYCCLSLCFPSFVIAAHLVFLLVSPVTQKFHSS